MAPQTTFLTRFRTFASTPEGQRLFREARRLAKDPATRRRIDATRRELAGSAAKRN